VLEIRKRLGVHISTVAATEAATKRKSFALYTGSKFSCGWRESQFPDLLERKNRGASSKALIVVL
jgi:hypothetical protein